MATRTVLVRVAADTAGFTGPMRAATTTADAFGSAATRSAGGLRGLRDETTATRAGLTGVGEGGRQARTGLTGAGEGADGVTRGLRGVTATAPSTTDAMRRVGSTGSSAFGAVRGAMSRAASMAGELGLILAGGEIFRGLKEVVEQGNEYNDSLNKFQEVTRATGAQMRTAGTEAQALGSDLKLPQASAAESADAMVELAKAGLSAQDAITATRGTIQLASAARTDVATAARIEGDALDQFGLKAADATTVADTLANVANSTSGELTDLAYALKYVGPTAHSMGISVQDAATAIGLLGKSGIIGETAGTALRSALVNMSKPTGQMKTGLKALGVQAYDSQGNFKGLEYVIGKLHDAQEKLTTQQFTAAAAMAFGKPALSAMTALAHQGSQNFDQMALQVGRTGGAAALAAAESKGLGGAMRGLGKELSSTFLQLYLAVSPSLEGITRKLSGMVAGGLPYLKRGIKTATDLWDIFGPSIEAKFSAAAAGIASTARSMVKPVEDAVTGLVTAVVPVVAAVGVNMKRAFDNVTSAAEPVVSGIKSIAKSVTSSGGALSVFNGRLSIGATAVEGVVTAAGKLTGILGPIGALVGGIASAFGKLPGSMQLSVLGMLALRPFRSQIQGMQTAVTGYGRSAVSSFSSVRVAMQTQRSLASQTGESLGRYGSALAALEARSPALQAMGNALRGVSEELPESATRMQRTAQAMGTSFRRATASLPEGATQVQRFGASLRGVSAAGAIGALSGLKAAGRGLLGVLGGPWGLAITGAFAVMDIFSQHQQAAKQAVQDFTSAIQQDSGALGENTRALAAQKLQQSGALDVASKYGISMGTVEKAALGNSDALKEVNDALQKNATYVGVSGKAAFEAGKGHLTLQSDAKGLLSTINGTSTAVGKASKAYRDETDAQKGAAGAAKNATDPTDQLQAAIKTLGDSSNDASTKATALHHALDLLSGGELDVQAAVADMNQSIQNLNSTWADGVTKSDGYGKSLLQVDGSLNTTSKNGLQLWNQLQDLNSTTSGAAQATYDYARANGSSVPEALKKAEGAMQRGYDTAVKGAHKLGIPIDKAKELAAQMGFIPTNLALTLSMPGYSQTQKDLLYVQGLAKTLPKGGSIKVTALTAEATKELKAVGVKIETLPGGRQMVITAPTAKAQAGIDALVGKRIPGKSVPVTALTSKAIADLQGVQAKVRSTKGKSVTVNALTGGAQSALSSLGFKVTHMKNGHVSITLPTGPPSAAASAIQSAIDGVHGKTVSVMVQYEASHSSASAFAKSIGGHATGGLIQRYADGGNVQYIPSGGPVAGPGTGTSDSIPALISNGEYVIKAASVQKYGVAMFDRLNAGRYASGGAVGYADGGFTYTPTSAVSTGTDDPRARFDDLVGKLRDAWSTYQSAVKDLAAVKKDKKSTKAERAAAQKKVSADYADVKSLDSQLGLKAGSAAPKTLNLTAYEKQLTASVAATNKWQANLAKIGAKGGSQVEQLLADMGTAGYSLVNELAGASTKQFNDITAKLLKLGDTAKASLADFTQQITTATTSSKAFQDNLLKLSSMGYGDLATQLASQGDDAAASVAAAAVKDKTSAAKANTAAKANASLLTGDDLTNAMTLLGVLRAHPGAGIADVIAGGLDWDTIRALAPKIGSQVRAVSGSGTFVSQMTGQGVAMAKGGIAEDGANVLFAEKGTGGEAFIPLGPGNRARSTGLLSSVAGMFGYQLTPVGMNRSTSSTQSQQGGDRHYTVHLHGAKQSSAEQAQDLARHMAFIG